jgi:hypothetical protein
MIQCEENILPSLKPFTFNFRCSTMYGTPGLGSRMDLSSSMLTDEPGTALGDGGTDAMKSTDIPMTRG